VFQFEIGKRAFHRRRESWGIGVFHFDDQFARQSRLSITRASPLIEKSNAKYEISMLGNPTLSSSHEISKNESGVL
jgi:hypothetical protein